jgi:ATP-dependent DNA ligase
LVLKKPQKERERKPRPRRFAFAPMPLAVLDEPFDHDAFIFELNCDGFRALAHVDSGRGRLESH